MTFDLRSLVDVLLPFKFYSITLVSLFDVKLYTNTSNKILLVVIVTLYFYIIHGIGLG